MKVLFASLLLSVFSFTTVLAQLQGYEEMDTPPIDVQPEYPGGQEALYAYLGQHITYPATARRLGIEGRVYVQFVIRADGSVTDVLAVQGIGAGCDEEAIRVVKSMPNWTPGYQKDRPVAVKIIVPITFSLGGSEDSGGQPASKTPAQAPKKGAPTSRQPSSKKGGGRR